MMGGENWKEKGREGEGGMINTGEKYRTISASFLPQMFYHFEVLGIQASS